MPRISPPTITASAVWAYGTRTLTGITGTPRIDLTGADEALSPSRIWAAPTRELTQAQFPFWSAIIEQVQVAITVAGGTSAYTNIQPPAGETWLIDISGDFRPRGLASLVEWFDYDGVTRRTHGGFYQDPAMTSVTTPIHSVLRVLTNSLYGSFRHHNPSTVSHTCPFGYSGFKLSKPLARLIPLNDPTPPFRRKPSRFAIPAELEDLRGYIVDVYESQFMSYKQAIELERGTEIAKDERGNVVMTQDVYALTDEVLPILTEIKADPERSGWKKYLDKWAEEGITL